MAHRNLPRGLLYAAVALLAVPFVVNPLLLIAGTFHVANPSLPGASLIGLENLSIVSFNGIVPSNTTHPSYLVKLSYFPSAFTWSYPSAPTAPTSGILLRGPTSSLDPFALIETIPPSLPSIPPSDYRCLQSHYYPPDPLLRCTSPFWTAVLRNRIFAFTFPVAWLPLVLHVSAAVVLALLWAAEWMMVRRKGWMRCQCPRVLAGLCPLPKGSAQDMEALGESEWDRVRVYLYWTAVAYCVLPLVHGAVIGSFFVRALERFDTDLPKGMSVDAELGGGFLGLVGGSTVCAVVAALCVTVRWRLGKPKKGWMEQQEIGALQDVDGEADGEYRGEERDRLGQQYDDQRNRE